MTLDPKALDYSEYLLGLDAEAREAAGKQLNQLLAAGIPDDEVPEGPKPPVRTLGEYLDTPVEKPPVLVEPGLVAVGAISALVARGGKGKTAVSLNRLIRWSMGKPLFDELPDLMCPRDNEPLKILIIENEGNGGHFQGVMQTILDGSDFEPECVELARNNIHIWGDGGWSGLKIDEAEDLALVSRATGEIEADIVFIEPFRGLWKGDENSSTDMQVVADAMSEVANVHGCGVMLTHHENKSGTEGGADPMNAFRGSTVLEGAAAVMERWVPVSAGRQRELSCVKNRFDEEYAPVRLEFERDRWGYRFVAENEERREVKAVLTTFPSQWLSVKDIAADLKETEKRTRTLLNQLADDDPLIEKKSMGQGQVGFRYKGGDGDPSAAGLSI